MIYFAIEIYYIVNTKLNIINSISGKLLIVEKEQYIEVVYEKIFR